MQALMGAAQTQAVSASPGGATVKPLLGPSLRVSDAGGLQWVWEFALTSLQMILMVPAWGGPVRSRSWRTWPVAAQPVFTCSWGSDFGLNVCVTSDKSLKHLPVPGHSSFLCGVSGWGCLSLRVLSSPSGGRSRHCWQAANTRGKAESLYCPPPPHWHAYLLPPLL